MDPGIWAPFVTLLESLLTYAGGVGILLGLAISGLFSHDADKQALGFTVAGTSGFGLLVGLLARDVAALFGGWVGL